MKGKRIALRDDVGNIIGYGYTDKKTMKKNHPKTKRVMMSQTERSEKFLERNLIGTGFRKPRKGLINLSSLDDLARM